MTVQHAIPFLETDADLPTALRLLLIEAAYRADRKGVIRHSQTELAATCGISRRTVAVYLNAGIEPGVFSVERRGRYALNLDSLKDQEYTLDERLGYMAHLARVTLNPKPVIDKEGNKRTHADADAELARLQEIRQPDQGIYYTANSWPVLGPIHTSQP